MTVARRLEPAGSRTAFWIALALGKIQRTRCAVESIGVSVPKLLQHRREQVSKWDAAMSFLGHHAMLSMLESSTRQKDWQIFVAVRAGVAHAASCQHHRLIQQVAAIRLFCVLQRLEEPSQLAHLEMFDLKQGIKHALRFAMVRKRVVVTRKPKVRDGQVAGDA